MKKFLITPLLLGAGMMVSCGGGDSAPTASTNETPAWLVAEAPAGAVSVTEVKANAKEGDRVTMRGKIGGRKNPMDGASPVFVVMDTSIPSCADNPADSCGTPWDYCCEPREVITANSATVQVVEADGSLTSVSLPSAGLKPLSEVIVVGEVAARPNEETLVVKAERIHIVGG